MSPLISVVLECGILSVRVVAKRVEVVLCRWLALYCAFEICTPHSLSLSLCYDPVSYKLLFPVLEEPSKLFYSFCGPYYMQLRLSCSVLRIFSTLI
jgi:hypothetical protein